MSEVENRQAAEFRASLQRALTSLQEIQKLAPPPKLVNLTPHRISALKVAIEALRLVGDITYQNNDEIIATLKSLLDEGES